MLACPASLAAATSWFERFWMRPLERAYQNDGNRVTEVNNFRRDKKIADHEDRIKILESSQKS